MARNLTLTTRFNCQSRNLHVVKLSIDGSNDWPPFTDLIIVKLVVRSCKNILIKTPCLINASKCMHGDIHADMSIQSKTEYPLGLHIGLPCSPCSVMTHLDMLSRRVSSTYFQNFFKGRGGGAGARSGEPRRVRGLNPNPRSRKTWILDLSHRNKQARGRRKNRTWIQIWYALRETAWDSRKKECMKNHEWFRSGGVKKEGWRRTNSLVTTVFTDLVPELDVSACIKSSFGTTHYHSRSGGHVDLHLWLKRALQIPQQRIKSLPTPRQRSGLRILITEEAEEDKCRNHLEKSRWVLGRHLKPVHILPLRKEEGFLCIGLKSGMDLTPKACVVAFVPVKPLYLCLLYCV